MFGYIERDADYISDYFTPYYYVPYLLEINVMNNRVLTMRWSHVVYIKNLFLIN